MGELLNINGKEIYVEMHGDPDAPPLLYLHGGPGSSCYDFMSFQAERLSESVYLIGMDQRGVLRSEALNDNEKLSPLDLVEDAEALRKKLGINSWSVLGHSFGGYLAVLYASRYPKSIDKLIFESPGFDFPLILRSLLSKASELLEKDGEHEAAKNTLKYVTSDEKPTVLMEKWLETGGELGARRDDLYFHGPEKNVFEELFSKAPHRNSKSITTSTSSLH